MHCFITCPKDHIGRLIALVCIVFIWAHSQLFAASMSHELWLPTRGYLQRAHAPSIDFYHSEAEMSIPGPVPLYRDFMRHYAESLLAADVRNNWMSLRRLSQICLTLCQSLQL